MLERGKVVAEGIFTVGWAMDFDKYLSLPSFVGKNRRVVYSYIEEVEAEDVSLAQEYVILWRKWDPPKICGIGFTYV